MRYVVVSSLILAALAHLLPLAGVLGSARLQSLYGLAVSEPNLEILLRHRAVLFGLLGLFMLYATVRPQYQPLAFVGGIVSVGSFLALAVAVGSYNSHLSRVVAIDVAVLVLLVVGASVLAYSKSIT